MAKEFCSPDDFGVLIPYKKLEKLVQSATKIEEQDTKIKRRGAN